MSENEYGESDDRYVRISRSLYQMVRYIAVWDSRTIQMVVETALKEYGAKRGVYLFNPKALLDFCPICEGELNGETVSQYLKADGVWKCDLCHKTMNQDLDKWIAERRREQGVRAEQAPAAAQFAPAQPPTTEVPRKATEVAGSRAKR